VSDPAVEITLPDIRRGDKWGGIQAIGPVTVAIGDGPALTPDIPLRRIRMQFRMDGHLLRTGDSDVTEDRDFPIVIDDDDNWEAHIPGVDFPFIKKAGTVDWDMEFYQGTEQAPLTFYYGSFSVTQDHTRPVPP